MRRLMGVLTFLIVLSAFPAAAGAAAPGGITQLSNPLGCLRGDNNAGGACTLASDVFGGWEIAVSPDNKNVYAISEEGDNVMIFDRNPTTSALSRKAGRNGCVVNGADTATCEGARHLDGPLGMAFNPNGSTLYVSTYTGAGAGVLTFDRASNGVITQRPGGEGCIANNFIPGDCNDARALGSPRSMATDDLGKTLYVADVNANAITALAINPADGTLSQISDTATEFGCVEATPSECGGDGLAMSFPWSVDVSPDGNFVYLGTLLDQSVVGFARNPSTGRIKPLPAPGGCLDSGGTDSCTVTPELSAVFDLQVSPSGGQIYVSSPSQNRVLAIDRSGNTLTRRSSSSGCVSQTAAANCGDGAGLTAPEGLGLSPDGQHLYVASADGVAELNRTSSGGLTPRSGSRSCVTEPAQAPCASLRGLAGFQAVTVSGDGRSVYAQTPFGDRGLGVFKRDSATPSCSNGSASVAAGSVTALPLACTDGDGDAITRSIVTPPGLGVLGPVNQGAGNVTFASSGVPGATSFTYRATSNGVSSNTATFTLNVTGGGGGGGGGVTPPPPGPTLIPSTVTNRWLAFPNFTKSSNLSVNNLPAGATVRVTCKTKKKKQQKKGCPYKSKRVTTATQRTKLNLRKPFAKKRLPVGTKITISITAPNMIGKRITYTVRKRAVPKVTTRCLPPGGKASRCV